MEQPIAVSEITVLLEEAARRIAAGEHESAITIYHQAVAQAPQRADLLYNLGVLYASTNRVGEALSAFAAAQARRPEWGEPWLATGQVLFGIGRYLEAAGAFEAAIERAPELLEARYNAAQALIRAKRWSLAVPHLERSRELAPANEAVWFELRTLLLRLSREDEARDDFRRYEKVGAQSARTVVAALRSCFREGDAAAEAAAIARALEWPYAEGDADLVAEVLALVQYVDLLPERLLALYRTYDRLQQAKRGDIAPFATPRRDASGRIRIGYLSADFRAHVMGRLLLPVVSAHDRDRFSIRAYALAPQENSDAVTAQWKSAVDEFVFLAALDDHAAAEAIAADDLDLLIDLMGHSSFARPGILLYKPARLIATHLGYHGAVGLSQVDFKITDRYADTALSAAWQLEAPLPLSVPVLPLAHVAATEDPALTRAALGIASDAIVYGVFVGTRKLSPRCALLWRRILDAVPGAVLAFSPPIEAERAALERRAVGFGLPRDRLVFIPYRRNDVAWNRARYALVDIVLDTMPYSGGDTTGGALDAGVPVITRVGARHAERMSYSLLMHLSLDEMVTTTDDDYVALAVRVARDSTLREAMRQAVARAMSDPRATDPERYVRALEEAYVAALAA
jgi:predicted O-linked N-acetylglucosamine transferase (SPINDLY family)